MVRMKHAYDDERLVELLVEKRHTHVQIAEMLGISESLVKKISCGLRRPELQRKMWDVENGLMSDARRLGARYARGLVSRQIELGLSGEGEGARRARARTSSRPRRWLATCAVPSSPTTCAASGSWTGKFMPTSTTRSSLGFSDDDGLAAAAGV